MAITETNITCTICDTFKRVIYEGKMPKITDWKKFIIEREGQTKTKYICPDCIEAFEKLFDDWYSRKISITKPKEEKFEPTAEIEVKVEKNQQPKKRGRPSKKKGKK